MHQILHEHEIEERLGTKLSPLGGWPHAPLCDSSCGDVPSDPCSLDKILNYLILQSKADRAKKSCGVQADNGSDGRAGRVRDSVELQRELEKIEAQQVKKVNDCTV